MTRNTIAIAISLALLTGVILGQFTAVGSPDRTPRIQSSEHRLALVRSFYDGMNRYLDDENLAFLSLLAPGFRDMHAPPTETGSAETLVARLDELRSAADPPRFEIEEIHDLGQITQVRVSNGLPAQLSVGGFSIDGFATGSALEFLQVEGNAIVARWGQDDRIPRIESTLSELSPAGLPTALNIESKLIILEAGVEWRPTTGDPSWVVVERGAITLETDASIQRLTIGDARSAPHGIRRIDNRAEAASSAWIVSIDRYYSSNTFTVDTTVPPGVTIEERARSYFFDLPADHDRIRIEIAKVVAPTGMNIEPRQDALGHQVIVIDGAVAAIIHHGELLHVTEESLAMLAMSERESASISSGQAAASRPDSAISYRSSTPGGATLLLITIELAE
jgi:hypothetical protein